MKLSTGHGVRYFFRGFDLISTKGLKRFVLVPLAVNLALFSAAFIYLFQQMDRLVNWTRDTVPQWLSWIEFLIVPLAVVLVLFLFTLIFSTLANWIAAPFNGVLAERVEQHLTGVAPQSGSLSAIIKAIPRTLVREWKKLVYFIPRFIGFLLLAWILPVFGQIIWFLFMAWVLAVQYLDYAFDNNHYNFPYMRHVLRQNKSACFGFGATTSIITMVPFANLLVMPVAICGATALWVDELKQQAEATSEQ